MSSHVSPIWWCLIGVELSNNFCTFFVCVRLTRNAFVKKAKIELGQHVLHWFEIRKFCDRKKLETTHTPARETLKFYYCVVFEVQRLLAKGLRVKGVAVDFWHTLIDQLRRLKWPLNHLKHP